MIELGSLIGIILKVGASLGKDKIQRSEIVIKLLKKLGFDPHHPPSDFIAVYQYTLVEYGVGKHEAILNIFRQPEMQKIFNEALIRNNPIILFKEGEKLLDKDDNSRKILEELEVDVNREFYEFSVLFIEVTKRTRTPSEVLTNQRLESVHLQVGEVQSRINRLPTIEGIRTEIARSLVPTLKSFPEAESSVASQSRVFSLSQQMRGWFETLGYRFEKYEIWEDNFFEWIINVPTRRNRFDRIFVRGIEGEVNLQDITSLHQSVNNQQTDEGWLVTARRISPAARDEVSKPINRHLGCYTFDELVDLDADFEGYIKWLESEIQRRGIKEKYVPLACFKEEIDSETNQRIAVSNYAEKDGWIDGYIDRWLDDSAKEHVSVLGEFGTGKTWFSFHYAWVALRRYQEAKEKGTRRPRLPLVIPLRDYAKAVSVESLFSEFFFRKHEIPIAGYSAFEQLNRMGKLLLIFDGFDEMAARIDRQQMIDNFWQLARAIVPGSKVVLTCRTEHFPEAKEGRALLNSELQSSISNLTGEKPQFEVLELKKFNEEQIRKVLLFQTDVETVEKVMSNPSLIGLAKRPVMTELILEALPDIEAGKPIDMSRVYLYAIQQKMNRDIKAERTFTSLADKIYFLCELSWEMLSTDQMSLNYQDFPDRVRRLFSSAVQKQKDLDHWRYDMMGQTMLIRNSDGDYSPAHRSLLEFFVAYKFSAELGMLHSDFLEVSRKQRSIDPTLEGRDYKWSEYFHQNTEPATEYNFPLKTFSAESFSYLKKTFGLQRISPAVLELMKNMITADSAWSILDSADLADVADSHYIGGNILTLLSAEGSSLQGKDFSGRNLRGAHLELINLGNTNFSSSNLAESTFESVFLEGVNFSKSNLQDVTFIERSSVELFTVIEEISLFSCAKNNCIYTILLENGAYRSRKEIFLDKGPWNIYSDAQKKGFFLLKANGNWLGFWEFHSQKIVWETEFDGSPIKEIRFSDDGEKLIIVRVNNDIEILNPVSLEKEALFQLHSNVDTIFYKRSQRRLFTVEKKSLILTIMSWIVPDDTQSPVLSYSLELENSEDELGSICEDYVVLFKTDSSSSKLFFQVEVYDLLSGQHVQTYSKEGEIRKWSINTKSHVFCFLEAETMVVQSYLSNNEIVKVGFSEDADKIRSIRTFSREDSGYLVVIVEHVNSLEVFEIYEPDERVSSSKTFDKPDSVRLNSIWCGSAVDKIVAGSENGFFYVWNYETGSLDGRFLLNSEYSEMNVKDAENIGVESIVWLKENEVQEVPFLSGGTRILVALIIGFNPRLSQVSKEYFCSFKEALLYQLGSENPLFSYLDGFDTSEEYSVWKARTKKMFDRFCADIEWENDSETMKHCEAFWENIQFL